MDMQALLPVATAAIGVIYGLKSRSLLAQERLKTTGLLHQLNAERARTTEAENFLEAHRTLLQQASDMLGDHALDGAEIDKPAALNLCLAAEKLLNGGQADLSDAEQSDWKRA